MLNANLIGQTTEHETLLQLPFVCTEIYSEACLVHGVIPDRNADRYASLFSSLIHAFVCLLLSDSQLAEYDDFGIVHGKRFAFGVRDGVVYNHFPGIPR